MINTITINWPALGAQLAELSDVEQADFFKGFLYELSRYDTKWHADGQLAAIRFRMEDKTKKLADEFLPMLLGADK